LLTQSFSKIFSFTLYMLPRLSATRVRSDGNYWTLMTEMQPVPHRTPTRKFWALLDSSRYVVFLTPVLLRSRVARDDKPRSQEFKQRLEDLVQYGTRLVFLPLMWCFCQWLPAPSCHRIYNVTRALISLPFLNPIAN
jgi:hypothetical protein